MYIPANFQLTDQAEAVAFMQRYSFATLVSVDQQRPVASHLPFSVRADDSGVRLTSHLARANPQWKSWAGQDVLVIFTEPHAYISPTLYEKRESVPTWDYIAVHAYGRVRLLDSEADTARALEQLIATYEPSYQAQWESLPETFKTSMMRGIVAFEVEVTALQGQQKLSQNKSAAERTAIAAHLANGPDSAARELAPYIQ
ncbi:FMN-binding negative transcriptional regulator [Hymenobacter cellulosivorans]|uniref:FMN-binding negative transcriptional regulator n=1 Tax=Hymenobacter cellulosivorans TaxID=2932249 RepID=A0ABY4FFB4_9BACT|nr:FMN-binding negative transcriptional regulator [Hymenobacter cellulosivorans]UOQ53126.1 FMN-binding negative transcriptional regulator [Hymenobacter cellulosivorans]